MRFRARNITPLSTSQPLTASTTCIAGCCSCCFEIDFARVHFFHLDFDSTADAAGAATDFEPCVALAPCEPSPGLAAVLFEISAAGAAAAVGAAFGDRTCSLKPVVEMQQNNSTLICTHNVDSRLTFGAVASFESRAVAASSNAICRPRHWSSTREQAVQTH